MNRNDINRIIVDFAKNNLSPQETERREIAKEYEKLKTFLDGKTLQNGSYARFTSTTPVHDLDVIYVLPEEISAPLKKMILMESGPLDISNILESLAEKLRHDYASQARVKTQPHSVGIYFGSDDDFSIDVVPAIPIENEMFRVPESSHLSIPRRRKLYESNPTLKWIKSDPKGYIKDASNVDERTNGYFRKTAKFVKKWKNRCKEIDPNFRLKSFHLELVVTEFFQNAPALICFDVVEKFFINLNQKVEKPQIPDKADKNMFVDQYLVDLTEDERSTILKFRNEALSYIKEMEVAQSETKCLELIKALLFNSKQGNAPNVISNGATRFSPAYSKPYCII
ncbi:hypothetical protein HUU39_17920 [candidate division KSB1 bacterium]|nr:hypothetical protein [bacterium]NUM67118.1 hypothetical protein [candidate division KSB1 bacterium]